MNGFNESFNSHYCCRFCREPKEIIETQTEENFNALQTVENYTTDLSLLQRGIKRNSLFKDLPNYHVTKYLYVDVMHDLLEGV